MRWRFSRAAREVELDIPGLVVGLQEDGVPIVFKWTDEGFDVTCNQADEKRVAQTFDRLETWWRPTK